MIPTANRRKERETHRGSSQFFPKGAGHGKGGPEPGTPPPRPAPPGLRAGGAGRGDATRRREWKARDPGLGVLSPAPPQPQAPGQSSSPAEEACPPSTLSCGSGQRSTTSPCSEGGSYAVRMYRMAVSDSLVNCRRCTSYRGYVGGYSLNLRHANRGTLRQKAVSRRYFQSMMRMC